MVAQAAHLQEADRMPKLKPLKALDQIADIVLAFRPKARSKGARKRKRRAAKLAKAKA